MTITKINPTLLTQIGEWIKANTKPELYWDHNDRISAETVAAAIEANPDNPMAYIYDLINIDTVYDAEMDAIKEGIKKFEAEISKWYGLEEGEEFDADEIAKDHREELIDYVTVDYNMSDLLKGSLEVRVELLSNYDCINSHWLESQSPFGMDSYYGDVIKTLGFNPQAVKKMLIEKGYETYGKWPKRADKSIVKMEDFWSEDINRGCGACLLVFVGKIDIKDLLNVTSKNYTVTIPKGNYCGFYSSMQGGGSMIEAPLLRDVKFDLGKNYDGHGMGYRMVTDTKDNGYTIDDAYGVTSQFWGKTISITENKTK